MYVCSYRRLSDLVNVSHPHKAARIILQVNKRAVKKKQIKMQKDFKSAVSVSENTEP